MRARLHFNAKNGFSQDNTSRRRLSQWIAGASYLVWLLAGVRLDTTDSSKAVLGEACNECDRLRRGGGESVANILERDKHLPKGERAVDVKKD